MTKKVSCAQHNMNLQFIYVKLLSTSSTRLKQTSCGLNQGATRIRSFCFGHRLYTAWQKHTKYGNKKDGIASFLPLGVLYKIYRYVPLVKGIAFEPFFGKRIQIFTLLITWNRLAVISRPWRYVPDGCLASNIIRELLIRIECARKSRIICYYQCWSFLKLGSLVC